MGLIPAGPVGFDLELRDVTYESAISAVEATYANQDVQQVRIGAIILAAGSSQRMGRPKMLLPWGDTSILGHVIQLWQALVGEQVTVVIAGTATHLQQELERLNFPRQNWIQNSTPERGMFSSIQCAANWGQWPETLTHWTLVLGDQPHLGLETLRKLLDFARRNPGQVCQPTRRSRWRHPVVLPKPVFKQLSRSTAQTLQEFLASCDRAALECEDPGFDYDIDTPEDYRKALKLAR